MSDMENEIKDKDEIDIDEPHDYKVILLNDDFTTAEFVVAICRKMFHKTEQEAIAITDEVHTKGKGVGGIYTYDIALTKQVMIMSTARNYGFPLKVELELI
jgi:ATP-dependent Clp protease adaptor protein ClpS